MGTIDVIYDHNHCTGAFVRLKTDVAYYTHITTQAEPTYVCILENLRNQIGLAFSTLKTTYNRDRLMIPVSTVI
jgi:hypothetical protein